MRSRSPRRRRVSGWDVQDVAPFQPEPTIVPPVLGHFDIPGSSAHIPAAFTVPLVPTTGFAAGAAAPSSISHQDLAAAPPVTVPDRFLGGQAGQGQRTSAGFEAPVPGEAPPPATFWSGEALPSGGWVGGSGNPHATAQPPQRKTQARRVEGWVASDFADLRLKHPPADPAVLESAMPSLSQWPCSPAGTPIVKFVPPEGAEAREAKWLWWATLSRIGFFVREMYAHTPYAASVNATAGVGTAGQEVVRTSMGTIIWMKRDKRLSSPNGSPALDAKLALVFPPFNPVVDMVGFHKARLPKQVAMALQHF